MASRRIRRSTAPTDPFPQWGLSKYVTLYIDNLVLLNEQHFVDSVSQRADKLKPPGHESLPHTSPNPSILVQNRIRGFRSLMSHFLEFTRICYSTRLFITFLARLCALSCTQCNKGLPCLQCKVHKFNSCWLTLSECVIVIVRYRFVGFEN